MSGRGRRLVLLRHAKAQGPGGMRDHDRPLTPAGRDDARVMGRWFKEHKVAPDLVICSTSARTRETWEQVAGAGSLGALIEHDGQAYNASVTALQELVQSAPKQARTVVVVGHAPGIPGLAAMLTEGQDGADELSAGFPTCTAAVLRVPVDWADVAPGTASVEAVHTARASET